MKEYVIKRFLLTIPVLLGVSILVFSVIHMAPGDPAAIMLGPLATKESIEKVHQELGLDRPLVVQYFAWMSKVVQLDFGRSVVLGREVFPEIWLRFKATMILTVASLSIAILIGVIAGITSAVRQYSVFDAVSMLGALAGVSMPVFFTGIVLIIIFSMKLNLFPTAGMYSPAGGDTLDLLHHLVLPAITLGTASAAVLARMTRSAMLETIRQDYIRTARSKGLAERTVIYVHALRNAAITIITVLGMQVGYQLGGAILTETVFSWPGIGMMMVRAIQVRDYPMVQGGVLFVAAVFVFVNILVDIAYAYLDPRIRYR
ncbi:MAG: ABC transporter permease [Deltaproteobacteria bacterium]|nr:MAG: ABC transporter permease [Deltaproteobacteria bacterium]RPJ43200.1 MAG: ABC transporter permease [Deltaproteobacteria bacterium]